MRGVGARVLLLQDDPLTRLHMVELLEEAGFEVLDTESGADAIRLMTDPDHLDLVVTQVRRPWPQGTVVARHARAHSPAIPVLFVTGAIDWLQTQGLPGPYLTLPQPFSREALLAAVDAMLRETAA